jgi:hypothetical protein
MATFAAMRDVATLARRHSDRLADSRYWRQQRERAETAGGQALDVLSSRIEQRYGGDTVAFGACHGDWTPWNMGSTGERVAVWDWERSGRLVPDGIDAAHFDFHLALGRSRKPLHALDQVLGAGRLMLARLGGGPRLERMLLTLDLLEMALRYAEGASGGPSATDAPELIALEALLAQPPDAPWRRAAAH